MKPNLRLTILVFGCAAGLFVASPQTSQAQCCGTYSSYYVPYIAWYAPAAACNGGCGSGCSACGTCGSCGTCSSCSSCSAGCGSSCGGCNSCGTGCTTCGYRACSGGCGSCCSSYYYPTYYWTWWPWIGAKQSTSSQLARSTAPTSRLRLTSSGATRRLAASPIRISASPKRLAASPKATEAQSSVVQAAARLPELSEQGPQLLLISQESADHPGKSSEWKQTVPPEPAPMISRSPVGRATTTRVGSKAGEKNVLRISGESPMV